MNEPPYDIIYQSIYNKILINNVTLLDMSISILKYYNMTKLEYTPFKQYMLLLTLQDKQFTPTTPSVYKPLCNMNT